jgi:hypothetical protein
MAQTGKAGALRLCTYRRRELGPHLDGVPWRHLHAANLNPSRLIFTRPMQTANSWTAFRARLSLRYLIPLPCRALPQSHHEVSLCDVHLCCANVSARLSQARCLDRQHVAILVQGKRACQKYHDETDIVIILVFNHVDNGAQILRCCRVRLSRLG